VFHPQHEVFNAKQQILNFLSKLTDTNPCFIMESYKTKGILEAGGIGGMSMYKRKGKKTLLC
jgi:hypothetical protein